MVVNRRAHFLAPAAEFFGRDWHDYRRGTAVHQEVIAEAAECRGISFRRLSAKIFILSDGGRQVAFTRRMSQGTSMVTYHAARDKSVTAQLLKAAGLRIPSGAAFPADHEGDAWDFARSIGLPVVIKPQQGSGGKGVTVGISDRDHFALAWALATDSGSHRIVETLLPGNDHRFFVVGDSVRAVARRWPAAVTGDGLASIGALVDAKNGQRQPNPYVGAKKMALTPMIERNLAIMGLCADSVLERGRRVELHQVANIGAGGESDDVTDKVDIGFCEIAVRAKNAFPVMAHAGIDIIAEDITMPPNSQRWGICEVNSNPDIALHHFPVHGLPRDTAGAFIDFWFPPTTAQRWRRLIGASR